jgi:AcrR family transcriptional regulator
MVANRVNNARAPSRTRERVLDVSLALFNELGAPNVTTNHIADEVGISPGNLYYHFRHKEDIVMGLFARYELALAEILGGSTDSSDAPDDLWLLVHLAFEVIHDFRFVHRDLSDLCAAYPGLRKRFQRGVETGIERTSAYCRMLAQAGALDASPEEAHALATNVALVTTYWLNLQALRHAGRGHAAPPDDETISEGVFQVLSLVTPYLRGPMQEQFRRVALRYLPTAAAGARAPDLG